MSEEMRQPVRPATPPDRREIVASKTERDPLGGPREGVVTSGWYRGGTLWLEVQWHDGAAGTIRALDVDVVGRAVEFDVVAEEEPPAGGAGAPPGIITLRLPAAVLPSARCALLTSSTDTAGDAGDAIDVEAFSVTAFAEGEAAVTVELSAAREED
jgi:hypothetical protein